MNKTGELEIIFNICIQYLFAGNKLWYICNIQWPSFSCIYFLKKKIPHKGNLFGNITHLNIRFVIYNDNLFHVYIWPMMGVYPVTFFYFLCNRNLCHDPQQCQWPIFTLRSKLVTTPFHINISCCKYMDTNKNKYLTKAEMPPPGEGGEEEVLHLIFGSRLKN